MTTALLDRPPIATHRRPRFRRSDPPPLRLTEDDLAILRHVAEHRFLRSTHLVRLLDRSPDKVLRRLSALYHNGYLDRPLAQREYFSRSGSAPLVYALGNRGALAVAGWSGEPNAIDWTDKNRTVGRPYIEHALLVADIMVGFEVAARAHPTIEFVPARTILADMPEELHRAHSSWTLTATLPYSNTEIAVTPDKVFALDFLDRGRRNYFFVEADRATMPIARASLAQSSFKKKLLAYWLAHQAGQHTARWGMPGFRVLTVTRSEERIESMIESVKDITRGKCSNMFLFGDYAKNFVRNPLVNDWTTGAGKKLRMTDPAD